MASGLRTSIICNFVPFDICIMAIWESPKASKTNPRVLQSLFQTFLCKIFLIPYALKCSFAAAPCLRKKRENCEKEEIWKWEVDFQRFQKVKTFHLTWFWEVVKTVRKSENHVFRFSMVKMLIRIEKVLILCNFCSIIGTKNI